MFFLLWHWLNLGSKLKISIFQKYSLLSQMEKYSEEQMSQLKSKYDKDLPRVKKLASFYSRETVQSPDSSVLRDQDQTDSSPILTLLCPITRSHQNVPVRTMACQLLICIIFLTPFLSILFSSMVCSRPSSQAYQPLSTTAAPSAAARVPFTLTPSYLQL